MRRSNLILAGSLLLLGASRPALAQDSLQVRLYHGLDEMGAGASFFWQERTPALWSLWQGRSLGIYRQPAGSFGDLKTSAYVRGEIGRSFRPNLDLEAIFEGDFFRFRQYQGPSLLAPGSLPPAAMWDLASLYGPASSPPQRIASPFLGVGGIFRPDSLLRITATAGRRWDHREGFDDQGFSATLETALQGLTYRGYQNDLNVYALQEELGARLNRELRLQYGLNKEFSTFSSDRLSIYYRQKRHDYHVWGTNSIGTRLDTDQSFLNQLRYDVDQRVGFLLESQLTGSRHEDRSVTASAVRDEINTATGLTFRAGKDAIAGWLRMKLDWGAQEDATGLKRERGTSLEQGLTWTPTEHDSLDLATAVRKRQYDTSDTANYDDRDRLRYEIDLLYARAFDRHFRIASRAEIALEHLVYIYSEKSDQNNWNRIFRLSPEVYFAPYPGWCNLARFEVAANFTDYDFELDPANIKSTVYRRYSAEDSLDWAIQNDWDMSLEYGLDLEDGGRLLWDEWIEQLAEQYRTQRAVLQINHRTPGAVEAAAGFSVYERRGWQYALEPNAGTVKSPFLYLTRWGPLLKLSYPSDSGVDIDATGDLSWVHEWGSVDYSLVNLEVRITWR